MCTYSTPRTWSPRAPPHLSCLQVSGATRTGQVNPGPSHGQFTGTGISSPPRIPALHGGEWDSPIRTTGTTPRRPAGRTARRADGTATDRRRGLPSGCRGHAPRATPPVATRFRGVVNHRDLRVRRKTVTVGGRWCLGVGTPLSPNLQRVRPSAREFDVVVEPPSVRLDRHHPRLHPPQ